MEQTIGLISTICTIGTLIATSTGMVLAMDGNRTGAWHGMAAALCLGAAALSANAVSNGQPGWAVLMPATFSILAAAQLRRPTVHTALWGAAIASALAASALNRDTIAGGIIFLAAVPAISLHFSAVLMTWVQRTGPMSGFGQRRLAMLIGANPGAILGITMLVSRP